ncbi:rtr1/RPAP2 family protein [Hirsutella rhossiliensis]|uniref:RNA polymerase II subunit B1 CTD phosphatase RPAP2 homolog n=1 Tax=Hirsutella rhossiliensis TaxID=111463 RepID=A0A9P8MS73_9HYPO|nr:rtr1/RPAP2 family domain-containing protein [Hirsutella rhossiliensis]KAH0960983.1 rtr1/RPAP2 family domain-containing protein [Hirsutella rhossiliensis]
MSTNPGHTAAADARRVALQHAELLRQRKDVESQILDSLVLLSEYPIVRSPEHSASMPAPSDAAGFKAHVRLFQPSDYADLIEERNVNGLCGYVLCARPRRHTGAGGEWKITSHGDIVKRKDLEMWCSETCARRALFVKVQLNETAAWERAGIPEIQIDLLSEDKTRETEADRAARILGEMQLEGQRHAARDAAALALDRGQRSAVTDPDKVKVTIKEKTPQAPPSPASMPSIQQDGHLLVEGHKSQLPLRPRRPD